MINKAMKRFASFKLFYKQVTYDNSWRNTWQIYNSEKANLYIRIRNSIMMIKHKDIASLFQQLLKMNNNNNRAILKTVITTLLTVKNV